METFVGDTPIITLKTGIDISGYSTFVMKFRRPDGSTGFWNAAIDPSNVKWMTYSVQPTDLNMAGVWAVQAHVEDLFGVALHGKFVEFTVFSPLPETTAPPTTLGPTTPAP